MSPLKIVRTSEFEGYDGDVLLEAITFEVLSGNRTRVVGQSVFQSVADRDGTVKLGVQKGAGEAQDKLARLLDEMKVS